MPMLFLVYLPFVLFFVVLGIGIWLRRHHPERVRQWRPYVYWILAVYVVSVGVAQPNLFILGVGFIFVVMAVHELVRRGPKEA